MEASNLWDKWVGEALSKLESSKLLRSLRPLYLSYERHEVTNAGICSEEEYEVFDEMQPWDRSSVKVSISESTYRKWLLEIPSSGDDIVHGEGLSHGTRQQQFKQLLLFSGNDYLGLSSHPAVRKAAAKAAQEYGMGPRGSPLICGYTYHHRLLESSLASLKNKEDCLLCPTGFSANMALMVALGNIALLLSTGNKPSKDEKIAIFSDELNHASIIDGIRLAERQQSVEFFVYKHCDMSHLSELFLFSMDGDFAPMLELVELRRKHNLLLVIDDAHGTFVCGKSGGGVAEEFDCERDVDICIGTLSKAAGCHGGFIACSKRWKQLIQSRGRSFIFSTATPVPIAAAAHGKVQHHFNETSAVIVAKRENWRRRELWNRVQEFRALTGTTTSSPIISLVVGSEEKALKASRQLLKSGFHVTAIRPPTVPPNSCRLRIALSAAHTTDDLKKLTSALSSYINFQDIDSTGLKIHSKL
ncbi:hypothetical protein V6N13_061138 [Hibiscus sabdariffa]